MESIVGTEYLPNAHIERIQLQYLETGYKLNITVALYDYVDQTWSKDNKFTSYLRINLASGVFKEEVDSVLSGDLLIDDLTLPIESKSFDSFEENMISIRGETYVKFKATFTVDYSIAIRDLCVFSNAMIDLEDLRQNESLNLSYGEQKYSGSLKAERVLQDGAVVSTRSFIYKDGEGEPWAGPVHIHESQDGEIFMGGSQHLPIAHPALSREQISGQKIEIHPLIGGVTAPGDLADSDIDPNAIFPRLDGAVAPGDLSDPNVFDPSSVFPEISTGPSMVFQEDPVEDHLGNISNTNIVDLENILIKESISGNLMARLNNALFKQLVEQMDMGNVVINRFPIKRAGARVVNRLGIAQRLTNLEEPTLIARSNNNRRKVKEKVLYKISPRKIISIDPKEAKESKVGERFIGKKITKSLLKNSRPIGKVEQLNLSLPKNLRAINFTDYDMKSSKYGEYKYQIKLTMKDEPHLFCKKLLKESLRNVKKLQNLYDVIIMKNVFNGDHFTSEFLQEFYTQYNIAVNDQGVLVGEFNSASLRDSYLIKSFQNLSQIESLVGVKKRQAQRLSNSVNLFSSNPEKILNAIAYYNKTIDRFKRLYRLSHDKGFEKKSPKKRKDRGSIEVVVNLKKTYERKKIKPIRMNFIDMKNTEGISRVNLGAFQKRSDKERKKFFSNLINKDSPEVKGLPAEIRNIFSDLETNRYKDFSPAKIFFGDKELDTTEINSESFDADFFSTLRITTAALNSNETTEEQEALGETEEQLDSYIDSREFLGSTSKFNNTILAVLSKKPLKIRKIRKKFKLLDNKILKAQKKNISLKTFDISQPNNAISALIKNQPTKIPMQIKALSLLKTKMTNFDLDTIEFDPISNPQTQEVFSQNYLNVGKVMMLEGFEMINGRLAMNKPIYKEIEPKMLDNLQKKNVLCKVVPQSIEGLTINPDPYVVHDKVFMLESTTQDQMNVQQLSGEGEGVVLPEEEPESTQSDMNPPELYSTNSPAEYSNTTPTQNPSNAAIVSVFPLQGSPEVVVVRETAPSPAAATISPTGVSY